MRFIPLSDKITATGREVIGYIDAVVHPTNRVVARRAIKKHFASWSSVSVRRGKKNPLRLYVKLIQS